MGNVRDTLDTVLARTHFTYSEETLALFAHAAELDDRLNDTLQFAMDSNDKEYVKDPKELSNELQELDKVRMVSSRLPSMPTYKPATTLYDNHFKDGALSLDILATWIGWEASQKMHEGNTSVVDSLKPVSNRVLYGDFGSVLTAVQDINPDDIMTLDKADAAIAGTYVFLKRAKADEPVGDVNTLISLLAQSPDSAETLIWGSGDSTPLIDQWLAKDLEAIYNQFNLLPEQYSRTPHKLAAAAIYCAVNKYHKSAFGAQMPAFKGALDKGFFDGDHSVILYKLALDAHRHIAFKEELERVLAQIPGAHEYVEGAARATSENLYGSEISSIDDSPSESDAAWTGDPNQLWSHGVDDSNVEKESEADINRSPLTSENNSQTGGTTMSNEIDPFKPEGQRPAPEPTNRPPRITDLNDPRAMSSADLERKNFSGTDQHGMADTSEVAAEDVDSSTPPSDAPVGDVTDAIPTDSTPADSADDAGAAPNLFDAFDGSTGGQPPADTFPPIDGSDEDPFADARIPPADDDPFSAGDHPFGSEDPFGTPGPAMKSPDSNPGFAGAGSESDEVFYVDASGPAPEEDDLFADPVDDAESSDNPAAMSGFSSGDVIKLDDPSPDSVAALDAAEEEMGDDYDPQAADETSRPDSLPSDTSLQSPPTPSTAHKTLDTMINDDSPDAEETAEAPLLPVNQQNTYVSNDVHVDNVGVKFYEALRSTNPDLHVVDSKAIIQYFKRDNSSDSRKERAKIAKSLQDGMTPADIMQLYAKMIGGDGDVELEGGEADASETTVDLDLSDLADQVADEEAADHSDTEVMPPTDGLSAKGPNADKDEFDYNLEGDETQVMDAVVESGPSESGVLETAEGVAPPEALLDDADAAKSEEAEAKKIAIARQLAAIDRDESFATQYLGLSDDDAALWAQRGDTSEQKTLKSRERASGLANHLNRHLTGNEQESSNDLVSRIESLHDQFSFMELVRDAVDEENATYTANYVAQALDVKGDDGQLREVGAFDQDDAIVIASNYHERFNSSNRALLKKLDGADTDERRSLIAEMIKTEFSDYSVAQIADALDNKENWNRAVRIAEGTAREPVREVLEGALRDHYMKKMFGAEAYDLADAKALLKNPETRKEVIAAQFVQRAKSYSEFGNMSSEAITQYLNQDKNNLTHLEDFLLSSHTRDEYGEMYVSMGGDVASVTEHFRPDKDIIPKRGGRIAIVAGVILALGFVGLTAINGPGNYNKGPDSTDGTNQSGSDTELVGMGTDEAQTRSTDTISVDDSTDSSAANTDNSGSGNTDNGTSEGGDPEVSSYERKMDDLYTSVADAMIDLGFTDSQLAGLIDLVDSESQDDLARAITGLYNSVLDSTHSTDEKQEAYRALAAYVTNHNIALPFVHDGSSTNVRAIRQINNGDNDESNNIDSSTVLRFVRAWHEAATDESFDPKNPSTFDRRGSDANVIRLGGETYVPDTYSIMINRAYEQTQASLIRAGFWGNNFQGLRDIVQGTPSEVAEGITTMYEALLEIDVTDTNAKEIEAAKEQLADYAVKLATPIRFRVDEEETTLDEMAKTMDANMVLRAVRAADYAFKGHSDGLFNPDDSSTYDRRGSDANVLRSGGVTYVPLTRE